MKIKGYDAAFKDNVLAIKRDLRFTVITIEGVSYKVNSKKRSEFNPEVYNYYLEPYGQ